MVQWLNYKIRVTIQDRRDIVGQFLAFDRHMNLIIADSDEYRRVGGKGSGGSNSKRKEERVEKRSLGLVLLRGENIVSISIEAPPAPEENRNRQAPILASAGPGIAKSVGRGIPSFPTGNIPNLGGPVKVGMIQPGMLPKFSMPPPGMPHPPGMPFPPPGMVPFPMGMMPPPGMGTMPPPSRMPPQNH